MTIQLIRFQQSDIQQLLSWIDFTAFCTQWGGLDFQWPLTEEQLLTYIKENNGAEPERLIYKAVDGETGETVGHIALGKLDRENKTGRVENVLVGNPDHHRKELEGVMVTEMCRIGFEEMALERISLGVIHHELTEIQAYEQVGFRQEGLMRRVLPIPENEVHGRWSLVEMAMLKEEWFARKLTYQWEPFKSLPGTQLSGVLSERLIFHSDLKKQDGHFFDAQHPAVLQWNTHNEERGIEIQGFLNMTWYEHDYGDDVLQVAFQDTPDPLSYLTDTEPPYISPLVSEYSFFGETIEQITGYGFLDGDQGHLNRLIIKLTNSYVSIESTPMAMEVRVSKLKPEPPPFFVLLFEWGHDE